MRMSANFIILCILYHTQRFVEWLRSSQPDSNMPVWNRFITLVTSSALLRGTPLTLSTHFTLGTQTHEVRKATHTNQQMDSSMSILALPVHVLRVQLLAYLTERDLTLLDIACCSGETQAGFRSILHGAILNNSETIPLGNETARWMLNRQCFFTKLAITDATASGQMDRALQNCLHVTIQDDVGLRILYDVLRSAVKLTYAEIHTSGMLRVLRERPFLLCPLLASVTLAVALSDSDLAVLTKHCPNMKDLVLYQSYELSGRALHTLAERCASLQRLFVVMDDSVTDADISALAQGCSRLQYLHIENCFQITDAAVTAVVKGCPGLTTLVLETALCSTDAALRALAAHCPGLIRLDLGDAHAFTDAAVIHLAERCSGLLRLSLCEAVRLTDAAIMSVAASCADLERIELNDCLLLTDRAPTALGAHCAKLQVAQLSGCELITDEGVTSLARGCPALYRVYLSECALVTDSAISVLSQCCPAFQELTLREGALITDAALLSLAEHSAQLRLLHLQGCARTTEKGRAALRSRLPDLKVYG